MTIRSYKYRMYPDREQQQFLDRNFGAARFIWNSLVANFNLYGTDTYIKNLSEASIKKVNVWLNEVISYGLQQKRMDFFEFTKQFFNKKRKKKLGRPKFKKKRNSKRLISTSWSVSRLHESLQLRKSINQTP